MCFQFSSPDTQNASHCELFATTACNLLLISPCLFLSSLPFPLALILFCLSLSHSLFLFLFLSIPCSRVLLSTASPFLRQTGWYALWLYIYIYIFVCVQGKTLYHKHKYNLYEKTISQIINLSRTSNISDTIHKRTYVGRNIHSSTILS